jgi:hypothetical protein
MAAQGRRGTLHDLLPGGLERFAVPVLRDARDPARRVLDPLELHHIQQMRRHWVHDPVPPPSPREQPPAPPGFRRWLQDKRRRRASEDEELFGPGPPDVPQGSRPFWRLLQDARQRSQRLHTDAMDLEGPGKFHDVRSAPKYTRQLAVDNPVGDFRSGDTAALKPTPRGDRQEEHDERPASSPSGPCRASPRGLVGVIFCSDRQVSTVKAESLDKVIRAEAMARRHGPEAAALGSGTTSDISHGPPGLRARDDAGQVARPLLERSLSLPGLERSLARLPRGRARFP